MKSIKNKIIAMVLSVVVVLSVTFGLISGILNYRSSLDVLETSMTETAIVSAERVYHEIKEYTNIAMETGSVARLSSPDLSVEEKKAIIDQRASSYGFERGNLIGLDGISLFDGNDYSERDYFQASVKGTTYISDPLISKITGKMTFIISAPLWENGMPDTTVKGVVYFVPNEEFLNQIVTSIQVGEKGSAYLLNRGGTTIAHRDASIVGVENAQKDSASNPALKPVAAIEKLMVQGETGFGQYQYNRVQKVLAYAPVKGTNGWSLGITAEQKEFTVGTTVSIYITIGLVALFITIGTVLSFVFGSRISKPILACADRLQLMAAGDLTSPVPTTSSRDETKRLMDDLHTTIENINHTFQDVSYHLSELSKGNLTTVVSQDYPGDFRQLKVSAEGIIAALNKAMGQISITSEQVAIGSEQVSAGAQALSQGATEQASSVEELAATLNEISRQVEINAESAQKASKKAEESAVELDAGRSRMGQMTEAMSDINRCSGEIGRIIKTIQDIAFQTNILALNAAVEAARAGNAGKGFAVVADEVRSLASKSGDAARDTAEMIASSIKAVENGTKMVDMTAKSFDVIIAASEESAALVQEISAATVEQAHAISQVNLGVDQISTVVQTNSATAEESAAASEELSQQAQALKDLVARFRTKPSGLEMGFPAGFDHHMG